MIAQHEMQMLDMTCIGAEKWYLIDAGGLCEVDGLPAIDKGSEGEVHVLNCGSAFPATNSHNGLAAPDSGCPVEIEKAASCKLDILLTFAVEVQGDFLSLQHGH